ncbi:MAG: hypothetical protein U0350_30645 [Caldilineaceae bacterium]
MQWLLKLSGKYVNFMMPLLLIIASLFPLWTAYLHHINLNDDTYITLTYARNLAAGRGFVFNHPPATLGTTTPLFTFVVAGLSFIFPHFDLATLAVFFTALCWAGIAWLFYTFRAAWALKTWQAVLVGLVIIASGWIAFLGMEAYLFAFLLVLCLSLFYAQQYFWAGLTAGLLFLTRGEGVLIFLILVGFVFVSQGVGKRHFTLQQFKPIGELLVGFAIPVTPWLIYAHATFNHWLPNTLAAKQAQGHLPTAKAFLARLWQEWLPGWELQFVLFHWPMLNLWWWLVSIGVITALLKQRRWLIFVVWLGLYIVGYTILHVSAYWWYQLPILFVCQLFAALGLITCVTFLVTRKKTQFIGAPLGIGVILLYLFYLGRPIVTANLTYSGDPRSSSYLTLAQWIREHTQPGESIAYVEIGYLGYYTDNRIIDLAGLVLPDVVPHIAEGDYAWGFWHYAPDYYIYLADFDWIVEKIHTNPEFTTLYREVATLPGPRSTNFVIYKRLSSR